jgi:hypothetical protein
MEKWWIRAVLGVVSIVICYGAASLAINTANMFAYAATVFFGIWAILQIKHSVRLIFSR